MKYYGYAGKILEINLSDKTIEKIPLDPQLAADFIGGIGISTKLLYDHIEPGIDPLSPGNVIIVGSGALGGTLAPTSARAEIVSKSPLSGFIGWANTGYSIANPLKYAGYDQLVIKSASENPVYIIVDNDEIEVRDASHLWGKDTWETTDILWHELGKDYWVTCIGPAGENLIRFACTISQKHSAAARTGLGAVMGSKKVKAIAVRGTKGIEVADKKRFLELVEQANNRFKEREKLVMAWRTYGFLAGFLPVVDAEEFLRLKGGYYACQSCPVGCNAWVRIPDGKYEGVSFLASAPGTKILASGDIFKDYPEIYKFLELLNRYGMDAFSTYAMINFAKDLYKNNIIDKKDIDGLNFSKFNPEVVTALTQKILNREGLGDVLAEGMEQAALKIGQGAEKYNFSIRGIDATAAKGGAQGATETFGYVTNHRAGMMERSTSISFRPRKRESYVKYCKAIGVPEEAVNRVCDGPEGLNVPRLTRYTEDILTLVPMQGLCRRAPVTQVWDINLHSQFYTAATGNFVNDKDLLTCAERVWNLQRCFNIREGAGRKDDKFPEQLLPMKLGGKELNKDNMDIWLNEYYDERGWDVDTGNPTKEKLLELGLSDAVNELKLMRILD